MSRVPLLAVLFEWSFIVTVQVTVIDLLVTPDEEREITSSQMS